MTKIQKYITKLKKRLITRKAERKLRITTYYIQDAISLSPETRLKR